MPLMMAALAIAPMAQGQRARIRFDDNWKFKLDQASTSRANAIKDWKYRASTLPNGAAGAFDDLAKEPEGEWKAVKPSQDTFDGKRAFQWWQTTLPAFQAAIPTLHVDYVDDNAVVFLNGKEVHRHKGYGEEFDVDLSSTWNATGPNILTVLLENTGGPGYVAGANLYDASVKVDPVEITPSHPDADWRHIHLPHDFVVEGNFDKDTDGSHGFLPMGLGWYRKSFVVPRTDKGKKLWIDFDGVFRNSTVWLNGKELGTHFTGYAPFRYDITDSVKFGGRNVLAVKVDARKAEGWWYEGGGIYRHVWLNKSNPVHIAPNGLFATSSSTHSGVVVKASVELVNDSPVAAKVEAQPTIRDASGNKVAAAKVSMELAAGETKTVEANFVLGNNVHLWSLEDPYRYTLDCPVSKGGRTIDRLSTKFGVRFIQYDAEKGFFLNGKPVKLMGTCNHQDF
ncbi:MAG: sugar-binding domain-containing protein, partial [Armatimonadota bacterium]